MNTQQTVNHWQHGIGVVEELLDDGFARVRFNSGVRTLSEDNLTDEDGAPLVVPVAAVVSAKTHVRSLPRRIYAAEITDALLAHLSTCGVDIRIMAAPEHEDELVYMLAQVGTTIPEGFECVSVGENGGVTRPWAPGFVCIFQKPPEGACLLHFRDEGGGMVSTASTPFALGLIKRGYPITAWKGKRNEK
jgi:hypothetical protein